MSDVVCFTRSRWGDESARDHPLMSRFARRRRVFVIEAPARDVGGDRAFVEEHRGPDGLVLCIPHLPSQLHPAHARQRLAGLVAELRARHRIAAEISWASAPAGLEHAHVLAPALVAWDCQSDPASLERVPAVRPDLVLVASTAHADARRRAHPNVHVMPPVIDASSALPWRAQGAIDPVDLAHVPGPRIGLAAPLDAHLDVALLQRVARELPDHYVVALGAPRGIDARALPRGVNVCWLGEKGAHERPRYLAGWDVALTPQLDGRALPELALDALAMGIPLVTVGVRDLPPGVTHPLLRCADAESVTHAIEDALRAPQAELARAADALGARFGWDAAFERVEAWIAAARERASRHGPGLVLARSSA